MINILDKWSGEFNIDGKVYTDIHNTPLTEVEDGDTFNIKLIPKIHSSSDTDGDTDSDTI